MIHGTDLLDAGVYDAAGHYVGRVRELCLVPTEQTSRIARFVIARGRYQSLLARYDQVAWAAPGTVRLNTSELNLTPYVPDEGWLTVRKDLLDQQIIDIHGRKVVRVNDVNLLAERANGHVELRITQVDVGLGGAVRRLLKGLVPLAWLHTLQQKLPTRTIPWEFVDVIETDPMRRVKLKLPQIKLRELHPADIADILEELATPEREAVMEELDDATAAEAVSELEPAVQASVLEEMEPERAADILEKMEPDQAADVLADLPAETAAEVLDDMDHQEARELVELMRFGENTAGGLMTPEVWAERESGTVAQAVESLRASRLHDASLDTVYLTSSERVLTGAVPLARLLRHSPQTPLLELRAEQLICADTEEQEKEVVELFDKYNLRSLPVVDAGQKLVGVITVDDVVHRLWQAHR